MRAFILLLFTCILHVQAQQMITDFCPDRLGNQWVYQYQRVPLGYDFDNLMITESLKVVVTLDDYEMMNSDTLYIFNVNESGIRTTEERDGAIRAEVIENQFNISVYFRFNVIAVVEDALYDEILARDQEPVAMINPLYRSHSVSSADLKKVWTGNDSLYLLNAGTKRFAQNTGMVYDSLRSTGNCIEKLKLLSFNGEPFGLWGSPVRNPVKFETANFLHTQAGKKLHLSTTSQGLSGNAFSLNGRSYRRINRVRSSIVVTPPLNRN
ncbi:MAG: hypothetical protein GX556_01410 [Fibrobacter sp.]|nr:hypothetical protein [Fibrobacter sp.]